MALYRTFQLTTVPGLEDVVVDEIGERCADATVAKEAGDPAGTIRVRAAAPAPLLGLRTIRHVVELLGQAEVADVDSVRRAVAGIDIDELERAASFRVSSRLVEAPGLDRIAVQRAAGGVLNERYGTRVDLEGFETEVRADVHDSRLTVGVQLTRDDLGNRVRRGKALRSSLKPTIAAAMVRLAGAHQGPGRLIDPMCGAGVIPVEAAEINRDLAVHAADWDPETVEAARETLRNHDLDVEVEELDARALGKRAPGRFDHIVTDPPYGLRQAKRASLTQLYRNLLTSFEHALKPNGRLVIIVVKYRVFLAALKSSNLEITSERKLTSGSLHPRIYTLKLIKDKGDIPL